ncbi:MAG: hypothetical protein QNJ12_00705 [Ilumatobacter sp.]|uniref:hypothetical protein n=1 Tax=Ilumatobacter sp. TaxID=1967498 RepID=UPI00262569EE|nr:hypothetical protein [Ilumatobacter sp.]MDJ0767271.1 hypothetical protein [Ilumatobacter sp.]
MIDRPHVAPTLVTVAGIVTIVGTFLPWVRSGSADRSSYATFDIVDRLGFSPDGPVGWALRLWPLVPLLVVLSVVAVWWSHETPQVMIVRRLLLPGAALYAGGTAFAIRLAPDVGLLRIGVGPTVTLVGALGLIVAEVWWLAATRRRSA